MKQSRKNQLTNRPLESWSTAETYPNPNKGCNRTDQNRNRKEQCVVSISHSRTWLESESRLQTWIPEWHFQIGGEGNITRIGGRGSYEQKKVGAENHTLMGIDRTIICAR